MTSALASVSSICYLRWGALNPFYHVAVTMSGLRDTTSFLERLGAVFVLPILLLFSSGCSDPPSQHSPGIEQKFRIGLITNNPNGLRNVRGFQEGLRSLGYVENENLSYRGGAEPVPKSELVAEIRAMVADKVDLIFTAGTPTGVAARQATAGTDIPVIFGVIADPVAAGVMDDVDRPGGNMTGVMLSSNQARRMELLHTFLPSVEKILVPYNPEDAAPLSALAQIEPVAQKLGLQLVHAQARDNESVTRMLDNFPTDIDAVFMLPDSTVNSRIRDLLTLSVARKLPVSGPSAAQVEAGALVSYGIIHHEVGLQAAKIADRVLRGANPGELPVETATFFLVLNQAAAERIGIKFDEAHLQQAERIIYEDQFGR